MGRGRAAKSTEGVGLQSSTTDGRNPSTGITRSSLRNSTFLIPDHLTDVLSPWAALAAAAQAIERIWVGPFILNNDFRHSRACRQGGGYPGPTLRAQKLKVGARRVWRSGRAMEATLLPPERSAGTFHLHP